MPAGSGWTSTQFAATLQEHRYAPRVDADVMAGQKRGIRGSPAIVIERQADRRRAERRRR